MKKMLNQLEAMIKRLAQQEIVERFNQVDFSIKSDGSLVTEADMGMQQAMQSAMQTQWPDIPLLGEEMSPQQQQQRLDAETAGLWILDPLDGTSNFASGIPVFSCSLALMQQGKVVLGIIYDPIRKECFSAIRGQGAWLNGRPLKPRKAASELSQCMAQVDLKRLPKKLASQLAAEHPYASQRNFGSGALDWCWLAAGRSQLYVHGGQKLWDYAAGQLILAEAGGLSCGFDRQAVFISKLMPRSVIAASELGLFNLWQACVLDAIE